MNNSINTFLKTQSIVLLAIIYCSVSPIKSYAQTWGDADEFTYDQAGNRIVRNYTYTIVSPKPGKNGEQETDTLSLIFNTSNLGIRAYPNPTTDVLIVESQNWQEENDVSITVTDITGRLVQSRKFTQAKETIPFKALVPGTYNVNYYVNNKFLTSWKVIKN